MWQSHCLVKVGRYWQELPSFPVGKKSKSERFRMQDTGYKEESLGIV